MTRTAYPRCGSIRSEKRKSTVCANVKHCHYRRCERRIAQDRKRGGEQCHGTTGRTSIRFCLLREGHEGTHLNGGIEWGGSESHPIAQAVRAGGAFRREVRT